MEDIREIMLQLNSLEKIINELSANKVDKEEYEKLRQVVQELKDRLTRTEVQIENITSAIDNITDTIENIAKNVENRVFSLFEKVLKWAALGALIIILILLGFKASEVLTLLK